MTKIVATIGPASSENEMLDYFAQNDVQIARLNCSHSDPETHLKIGRAAKESGLEVLMDLPGPKIRLGEVAEVVEIQSGQIIVLEMQKEEVPYPFRTAVLGEEAFVFPYHFPVHEFVEAGHPILVDDGKLELQVISVGADSVACRVIAGGKVKSRKGMNMPASRLEVNFLGERDKLFLTELMPVLRPEYIAASFVKTVDDIIALKSFLNDVLDESGIEDYLPKLCAKLEMGEALEDGNLAGIISEVDLIMIARGDLALETQPAHIIVPFLQEKIKRECRRQNKPFVVATQMLESMIDVPVPTRAEVSDVYRSVVIDQADFIMCSGETAMGEFPKNCINVMSSIINLASQNPQVAEVPTEPLQEEQVIKQAFEPEEIFSYDEPQTQDSIYTKVETVEVVEPKQRTEVTPNFNYQQPSQQGAQPRTRVSL